MFYVRVKAASAADERRSSRGEISRPSLSRERCMEWCWRWSFLTSAGNAYVHQLGVVSVEGISRQLTPYILIMILWQSLCAEAIDSMKVASFAAMAAFPHASVLFELHQVSCK